MSIPQENKNYSYEDYLNWPKDKKIEIIDGVLYMQAAPSRIHQKILGELYRQIANYLVDKPCEVYVSPFCVRLSDDIEIEDKNDKIKNVFEPDITIVCDDNKLDKEGCKGSPDMIIEVISPSTKKVDKVVKFNKYERAKVKEYWLVEPEESVVSVFVLQDNERYGRPEMYTNDDKVKVSIFPELEIDLNIVFKNV